MFKTFAKSFGVASALLGVALFTMGMGSTEGADQRNKEARKDLYNQATSRVPVPRIDNFLTRSYVAEYMRRMDTPNKVFYTYLQNKQGQPYQYIVGTKPISLCALMTPPDRTFITRKGNGVRNAPTLGGVFYGGDGSGICNMYYVFDNNSGALIQFKTPRLMISDQPLSIDTSNINRVTVDSDVVKKELSEEVEEILERSQD